MGDAYFSRMMNGAARAVCGMLFFLLLAAPVGLSQAKAQESPTPPFFKLEHEGATVWMLGTIHLLPPGTPYSNAPIDAAFAASDRIGFEILLSGVDQFALQGLMLEYGFFPPDAKLTDGLNPDERQEFAQLVVRIGLELEVVERFRPWLAAIFVSTHFIQQSGYEANAGVDAQFQRRATAAGKNQFALETAEQQLLFLATLPDDVQYRYLMSTIRGIRDEGTVVLEELRRAWFAGDIETLDALSHATAEELPEIYDVLITKRNRDWVNQLDGIIKEGGTVFLAVGAAHLAGPDSVVRMLRDQGYTVTRQ